MTAARESDDRWLMPDFPRTKHAPWSPSASRDDLIATDEEIDAAIRTSSVVILQEKADGAQLGLAFDDSEQPIARNRNHFLRKSFSASTPAKAQFSSLWNWMYERRALFDAVSDAFGERVSVYGEWLVATHSVRYDKLPDWLLAYDVWVPSAQAFASPDVATERLLASGFSVIRELRRYERVTAEQLMPACLSERVGESAYSSVDSREGVYVKMGDGTKMTYRMKVVSREFTPGARWDSRSITKNAVSRAR